MKRIYFLIAFSFSLFTPEVTAQSIGDTIVVPVLDYLNPSRSVVANFPTNPSVSYEKVIMRYAMRCKNGLISSGGQRNLGCGEWDYSCNTYLTDSTNADSSSATIAKYRIFPDTNSSGIFSNAPTWWGNPIIQSNVNLTLLLTKTQLKLVLEITLTPWSSILWRMVEKITFC